MSKFRISRGLEQNLPISRKSGQMYITEDKGNIYLDVDEEKRIQLAANAKTAEQATKDHLGNTIAETYETKTNTKQIEENLLNLVSTNYDESIIAFSVVGTTVTYIKGDGSKHSFETQDTNTTYSLGTDQVTGLTKLYATTGSAEDGTMTQKAIKTELDKKVGVKLEDSTLIFTI